MELGVVLGVVVIGFIHGVLPDHGWPIAATYALNKRRRWLYGLLAALILGVGHLVSSVVLVLAYFWFSTFAAFADGPWLGYVAGSLLILLGIHEYRTGGHGDALESHDHHEHHHTDGGGDYESEHGTHDHPTDHDHEMDDTNGLLARVRNALPGGGHQHLTEEHAERGLTALGATALLLGFAHEEPIQILAICGGVGTSHCLELMLIYSLAVIIAIIAPTLLLIAGYEHHHERIERYTPYLPTITAVALIGMGLAFIVGFV
ncbi:ABC transporter permease [Salinadaptatus halalkaliphilus]|uniref:ABC transporter permease n=1 Tax=Salinadaptatus halalkaliphilus TaxID=2419781 RepID=A0A4S3TFN2_9EURY|nr:ABC transporter permease [Salinadaptatus halalkaliphilus]THE62709.1 ABC transporter permease [Salinadaptatus halalkaliphilus]